MFVTHLEFLKHKYFFLLWTKILVSGKHPWILKLSTNQHSLLLLVFICENVCPLALLMPRLAFRHIYLGVFTGKPDLSMSMISVSSRSYHRTKLIVLQLYIKIYMLCRKNDTICYDNKVKIRKILKKTQKHKKNPTVILSRLFVARDGELRNIVLYVSATACCAKLC